MNVQIVYPTLKAGFDLDFGSDNIRLIWPILVQKEPLAVDSLESFLASC